MNLERMEYYLVQDRNLIQELKEVVLDKVKKLIETNYEIFKNITKERPPLREDKKGIKLFEITINDLIDTDLNYFEYGKEFLTVHFNDKEDGSKVGFCFSSDMVFTLYSSSECVFELGGNVENPLKKVREEIRKLEEKLKQGDQ